MKNYPIEQETIKEEVKSKILESYSAALEIAEQKIGFDSHFKKIKRKKLDADTINQQIEDMFIYGQQTINKLVTGVEPEKGLNRLNQVSTYIPIISNNNLSKYENETTDVSINEDKTKYADAHTILDDLYKAFNFGLLKGKFAPYDSPKPLTECKYYERSIVKIKFQERTLEDKL